jgi:hypothetical protein
VAYNCYGKTGKLSVEVAVRIPYNYYGKTGKLRDENLAVKTFGDLQLAFELPKSVYNVICPSTWPGGFGKLIN